MIPLMLDGYSVALFTLDDSHCEGGKNRIILMNREMPKARPRLGINLRMLVLRDY